MTTARCPTCDREGCPRPAAVAAYQATTPAAGPDDVLAAAIAMLAAEATCLAAAAYGRESRRAHRIKERAANKQAFVEMRTDAARWRKVAPLIERLADDVRRRELIARAEFDRRVSDTVTDLLAATESTP